MARGRTGTLTDETLFDHAAHEPRPRDFAGRFRRARPRGLRSRQAHSRKLGGLLVLGAAIAVPALAASEEWSAFHIGDASASQVVLEPMPFERAGYSFPGSAFYYLAADEDTAILGAGIHSDAQDAPAGEDPLAGPIARPLRVDNSGVDRTRALQCLTAAIYYEAASEPDAGQRAVAQVVLNRVAHPSYPNTVCGVVYQGSERRTGCQFSFTCDGSLARVPSRMFWLRAERVAALALAGSVYAPVGLATHYHTIAIYPYWAPSLHFLGTIGAHRFYRFGGKAGQPAAFRFAYAGGEPIAAPHARSAAADRVADPVLDPVAVQKAFEAGLASAQGAALAPSAGGLAPVRTAPAPAYAPGIRERGGESLYRGDRLPGGSNVRPEFRASGQWKTSPGT